MIRLHLDTYMIKRKTIWRTYLLVKNENIERKFNLQAIAYIRILIQETVFGHRLELNSND